MDRERGRHEFGQRCRSTSHPNREHRHKRNQHTPEHRSHKTTTFLVSFNTTTPPLNENGIEAPVSLHSTRRGDRPFSSGRKTRFAGAAGATSPSCLADALDFNISTPRNRLYARECSARHDTPPR